MPHNPLISVIMPAYNAAAYLPQAMNSILSQTYTNFELIVINDGSTDQTDEVIRAFTDTRIRYIENHSNLGIVETLNRGLAAAQGQYIARMDADDISTPVRFERQIKYLENHPYVGVLGSAIQIIDQNSRPIRIWRFPSDPALVRWTMYFTNPIAHPSVMMRKSLVQAVGGYRDYLAEDIDLWERLSQVTQLTNLSVVLLKLRKHGSNITKAERDALISSAAEISERMIQRSIGQVPPTDLVAKMYGRTLDNPSDSSEIARLIKRLYRHHVADPKLTRTTCRRIRRDAARRLLRLATRDNAHLQQGWPLLKLAWVLDPFVLIRAFASRASTLIAPAITRYK